eukprot:168604_1
MKKIYSTYCKICIKSVIAQLVATGASTFGRAFMQAYRHSQLHPPKTNGQTSGNATPAGMSRILGRGINPSDARALLNLPENFDSKQLQKNFDRMFSQNDPQKGGSFYVQSAIYRAKESLDVEQKDSKINSKD